MTTENRIPHIRLIDLWLLVVSIGRKGVLKLTEGDKDFVKDLTRKLILRAYLTNSSDRPRILADRLKRMFTRKPYKAPALDIFKAIENNRKN